MRRLSVSTIGLGGLLLHLAIPAGAQHSTARPAMKVYHRAQPGVCAHIQKPMMLERTRTVKDPGPYRLSNDTLLTAVRVATLQCASAYAGRPLSSMEQLQDVRVLLNRGQDDSARHAAERYLRTIDTSSAKRAWALHLLVHDFLTARQPRLQPAQALLRELDRLPYAVAAKSQFLAHKYMSRAFRLAWNDSLADIEASTMISLWKRMTDPDLRLMVGDAVEKAYTHKADIALRTRGIDAMRAVVDSAQAEGIGLGRFRIIGMPAPPIDARFQFSKESAASSTTSGTPATVLPEKGRVTLVVVVRTYRGRIISGQIGQSLRRYQTQFASPGFTVVGLAQTLGFFSDTAPMAPSVEAENLKRQNIEDLLIPGTQAVFETEYTTLPDGRRRNEEVSALAAYGSRVLLIDKKGIVRYAQTVGFEYPYADETMLGRYIEKLLAE